MHPTSEHLNIKASTRISKGRNRLHYNQEARNSQWGKDSLFNKYRWENWIITCKRMKLHPYLTQSTHIDLKCIKDLNVRPETVES